MGEQVAFITLKLVLTAPSSFGEKLGVQFLWLGQLYEYT